MADEVALEKVRKTEQEWRSFLTPQQYRVTRHKGTERAFTGEYWKMKAPGVYVCICCGNELFSSEAKFDSGTGWPSFYQPIDEQNVYCKPDEHLFVERTEVLCSRCDAHLGHVIDKGAAGGDRWYSINSVALRFVPSKSGPRDLSR